MDFKIQYQVPKIATRMKINVEVILDEKAIVRVCFYEDDNEYLPIDTKTIIIEGQAYKDWGNDDAYIKKIVYETLGIPIEPPVPVVPVIPPHLLSPP
jgi:hypothetical protein